jgi:hypothetical protein
MGLPPGSYALRAAYHCGCLPWLPCCPKSRSGAPGCLGRPGSPGWWTVRKRRARSTGAAARGTRPRRSPCHGPVGLCPRLQTAHGGHETLLGRRCRRTRRAAASRRARPATRTIKGKGVRTPRHFEHIAHRGACGKTRVVPQNCRPRPEAAEMEGFATCVRVVDAHVRPPWPARSAPTERRWPRSAAPARRVAATLLLDAVSRGRPPVSA